MELVWDEKDRGVKPGDKKKTKKQLQHIFFLVTAPETSEKVSV